MFECLSVLDSRSDEHCTRCMTRGCLTLVMSTVVQLSAHRRCVLGGSGPLVVVIKVAGSLRRQPDKFFPPSLPDSIETIAVRQPNPGTPATTDGSESLGRRVRRRRTCRAAAARGFGCSTSRPTRRSPAWRAAPTARRSSRRTSRYPPPLTHLSPLLLSAVSLTWRCACLSAVLARLRLVRCPDPGRDLHHQGRPERQDARVQAGDAAGRAARVHEHVAGGASWGEADYAGATGGRARRRRVQAVRMGLPPLGQCQPIGSVFGGFATVCEYSYSY